MEMSANLMRLKSDAVRYEQAMRAIDSVASMPLENPEVLKQALAIIDHERSNLKFQASKLIAFVVDDYTFTASLKRACPDKATADALFRRLRTNPRAVLYELNGAQVLNMRLAQMIAEGVALLRRVAEQILAATKEVERPAHEKKIASPGHDIPTSVVRVDIPKAYELVDLGLDPRGGFDIIIAGAEIAEYGPLAGAVGLGNMFAALGYSPALLMCYLQADAHYEQCLAATSQRLPNRDRDRRCARCMADLLTRGAACLSSPPREAFPWGNLPRYLGG